MLRNGSSGWKIAAACVAVLGLAGCVSNPAAYAPRGPGQATGYTDRQLAANRFRITFTGNSATTRAEVEDDLLRRAAEVTLAAGFRHFLFDSRDTRANVRYDAIPQPGFYRRDPFWGPAWGPGYWHFRPRWGYDPFGPDVDILTSTRFEAYAEIVLLTDEQAAHEARAVDANQVIAHLPPPAPA